MKKVIVTGASGLLGRAIVAEFSKNNWTVLGMALTRATDELIKVDLTDEDKTQKVINEFKPDVLIHCAAQRVPDIVEKEYEAAKILNVRCSKTLSELAREMNIAFIYISTDYVFDGTKPPYRETDQPNPLNKYGITKLQGEKEVLSVNPGSIVLRVPLLYGGESYVGESAVSSLIQHLLSDEQSLVSSYEVRYPSHTSDIAKICLQLSEKKLEHPSLNSIFHWCGAEALTKYTMLKIIAEEFSIPHGHVKPYYGPSSGTPRPVNTRLNCSKLLSIRIGQHTAFRDGIKDLKKFLHSKEN